MLRHSDRQQTIPARYRPGHAGYVSEFTRFMDGFLEQHPEVVRNQVAGVDIFWDHEVDMKDLEKANADSVPVKGYDYF